MPSVALVAAALTTPQSFDESVYIGGVRMSDVMKWDSITVTDGGAGYIGTLNAHLIESIVNLPQVVDQAQIRLVNHVADTREWTGYITSRKPISEPGYQGKVDLIAADISGILDDCFIAFEKRPVESISARMGYLLGKYGGSHLSHSLAFIAALADDCDAQRFISLTLRDAIETSIAQASDTASYRVDMLGRLHIFETETNDAPFEVNVQDPTGGKISVLNLSVEYDSEGYANAVYVQGANKEGSGYFTNGAAIARAGGLVRTKRVEAPDADTFNKARRFARKYLREVSNAASRGTFETDTEGWASGQNVTITDSDNGLSADEFPIARVTWRYMRPGTDKLRRFTVEFGKSQPQSAA